MKYEYKVERISSFLESYLNKKASQGWRCVSVMSATEPNLEWTKIAVFERIVDDSDKDVNNDITVHEEDTKDIMEDTDIISSDENTVLENIVDIQPEVLDYNKGSHEKSFSRSIVYYAVCSILLILYIIVLRFLNYTLHIL